MKKDWVDIAKSLGIILMVIGHSSLPDYASRWIYSFHMPLFFVLSGAFTNWDKSVWTFIVDKIRTLGLYFILYSIINYLLLSFSDANYKQQSISLLLTDGWEGFALWFIPVLLLSLILDRFICENKLSYRILLLFVVGALLDMYDVYLPWSLSTVPVAAGFVLMGRRLSSFFKVRIEQFSLSRWSYALILVLLIAISTISLFFSFDLAINKVSPVLFLILSSMSGTLFISLVSVHLCKLHILRKLLVPVGRNTLEIMAFSQVFLIVQRYLPIHGSLKYVIMAFGIALMVCLRKTISKRFFNN